MSDLTIKQERFAQKVVELGNASEAYRQSYDAQEMLPETIHTEAHRLLENPHVSRRIEELEALRLRRHEVTADRVILEMAKIAFGDIRKAFDDNGNLKPIKDIDDQTAALIAGIDVEELYEGRGANRERVGQTRKIKTFDKRGALESLMKHLSLFPNKVEVTGKDGAPLPASVVQVYLPKNDRD